MFHHPFPLARRANTRQCSGGWVGNVHGAALNPGLRFRSSPLDTCEREYAEHGRSCPLATRARRHPAMRCGALVVTNQLADIVAGQRIAPKYMHKLKYEDPIRAFDPGITSHKILVGHLISSSRRRGVTLQEIPYSPLYVREVHTEFLKIGKGLKIPVRT